MEKYTDKIPLAILGVDFQSQISHLLLAHKTSIWQHYLQSLEHISQDSNHFLVYILDTGSFCGLNECHIFCCPLASKVYHASKFFVQVFTVYHADCKPCIWERLKEYIVVF